MPIRLESLKAAAERSSARGAAAPGSYLRPPYAGAGLPATRLLVAYYAAFIAVALALAINPAAALAGPSITDSGISGTGDVPRSGVPALCDPGTKLATPWRPESEPAVPSLPGTVPGAVDGEGPFIGTAISEHKGPDVTVRPLAVRPKRIERTSQLGFTYSAPGASKLRAWVVMNQAVAKVAYPYLAVGSEPVKLGVRTVLRPREDGGKIHVKLDREAAYGVGPFLRVQLTLCAAASAANGNVTLTGSTVTLEAF